MIFLVVLYRSIVMGSLVLDSNSLPITDDVFELLKLPDDIIRRIGIPHLECADNVGGLRKSRDLVCHLTVGQFLSAVCWRLRRLFRAPVDYVPSTVVYDVQQLSTDADREMTSTMIYDFIAEFAGFPWLCKFQRDVVFINAVINHLLCRDNTENGEALLRDLSRNGMIKLHSICHNAIATNVAVVAQEYPYVLTRKCFEALCGHRLEVYVAVIENLPRNALECAQQAHAWVIAENKQGVSYHSVLINAGVEVNEFDYYDAVRKTLTPNALYIANRLKTIGRKHDFAGTIKSTVSHDAIPQLLDLAEIFGIAPKILNELVFKHHGLAFICAFIARSDYKFTSTEILQLIARYKSSNEFIEAIDGLGITLPARELINILSTEKKLATITELCARTQYTPSDADIEQIARNSGKNRRDIECAFETSRNIDRFTHSTLDDGTIASLNYFADNCDDEELIKICRNAAKPSYLERIVFRPDGGLSPISEESTPVSSRSPSPRVFMHNDY